MEFPVGLVASYLAAEWSSGKKPLRPWILAGYAKIFIIALTVLLVANFPESGAGILFMMIFMILNTTLSFAKYVLLSI